MNRTNVELKPGVRPVGAGEAAPFESNQCGIETNYRLMRTEYLTYSLNRTNVELKLLTISVANAVMTDFESNQCGIETETTRQQIYSI